MRLALVSDIHGNPIALDAVLADLDSRGGADLILVLGDLVAIGYDPIGVLERLTALPSARFVQGNTDRYVFAGDRPHPNIADVQANPALVPTLVEVAHTFAWAHGALSTSGWLDWLSDLPLEQRLDLPDGTRVLATHVAPGLDDGNGIHPALSDSELTSLVADAQADLVCVGHTHWPVDRTVAGVRVVNSGSVSNPIAFDLRASYALIVATPTGYEVQHQRVAYDVEAVIAAVQRSRHPSAEFIISHFRAERRPWWAAGVDLAEFAPR
jgi:putative phosphoesterase